MTSTERGTLLITGTAGFIGMHTALAASQRGWRVIGIDNVNDYYSPALKVDRLRRQGITWPDWDSGSLRFGEQGIGFAFIHLEDGEGIKRLCADQGVTHIIHLAAQAGVRYSIERPEVYLSSNAMGFFHMLECSRAIGVKHLVYASSSSVYGLNRGIPFDEDCHTDHPISLYAATKKGNEMMAHSYSHLFGIPTTGLRFFTVYGPWGRPDMALFKFTKAILAGEPIDVYNHGQMSRDFTYVDDIVEGLMRLVELPPAYTDMPPEGELPSSSSTAPYRILNIGRNAPVSLEDMIRCTELAVGRPAIRNNMPIQPGDVERTYADVSKLIALTGHRPAVPLEEGIGKFVEWYRGYYGE